VGFAVQQFGRALADAFGPVASKVSTVIEEKSQQVEIFVSNMPAQATSAIVLFGGVHLAFDLGSGGCAGRSPAFEKKGKLLITSHNRRGKGCSRRKSFE